MLFSSLVFLFTFLPITLLVYYLVPRKVKNVVLLIASLIFYAWGEPVYIFLMLISILFNYFCGMDIALKAGRKSQVRSLIFTIVVNLFILGFFKYYGFIVTNLNAILPFYIPYRKLELPIGISFYTFQTLSYIIDVYRGNVDVQVNLIDFGTYVTMFPQLIAGPIVQYADVERQLRERKESLTKFGYGAWFFVMGLAKKVLLANTIGSIYENIAAMDGMSVVTAWLGCLAYTFQIYFDFSGYSDMAVGLGKMFGFEFMQNFNYPYISKSVTEFWRRWHITLGTWMKDYVFYPFSISKHMLKFGKKARKVFGRKINVRMREGFFPFTEPGYEIDMECLVCGGKGCRVCNQNGWIEVMPGGVIHPNVLRAANLDPDVWTGFYTNIGLDRLVMMRYGVDDVRLFHSADLRFLEQFK